jgi:hypothetical protein
MSNGDSPTTSNNPLESYFDGVTEGPGIWKWRHYFDVYHRHLARFRGRPVTIVEVGIYSGGNLSMWRQYLGPEAMIVGIDIEEACRQYEVPGTRVFIGDQADRTFWGTVRREVPHVDILIDDGGHSPEQQMVTLEEMLPHIRPGGVFVCEDIHGEPNGFSLFVGGLSQAIHHMHIDPPNGSKTNALQRDVHSIHQYPFVVVIEKNPSPISRLYSEKHGTQWQPFFGRT